jgi:AraC-like DNA-binding protein
MIYLIGIAITFFLSLILLTKKGKSSADRILFGWLCVILVQLILFSVISSKEYVQYPYLLGLEIPLPLLHGPFLFLYTMALTIRNISFRKMSFHFIPYTIAFLLTLPFLLLEHKVKIYVYQNEGEGYNLLSSVILLGIILSGITYTVLSLRTLMRHRRLIRDNFSYTEKINLEWLYRLIIGLSCIWILVFFADNEIILTSVVLFVVFIGYYGIKHVGIFTNQPQLESLSSVSETIKESELVISPKENTKYERSSLADNQAQDIHKRLVLLMKEKKLYQTPELTLAMVSEELDVHPNTLSQVINAVEQKNFFDYINTLRIEEFKERVASPDNQKYTLLSLAYQCGFNSKTSFNRNFKNLTEKSPSEYLKESKVMLDD